MIPAEHGGDSPHKCNDASGTLSSETDVPSHAAPQPDHQPVCQAPAAQKPLARACGVKTLSGTLSRASLATVRPATAAAKAAGKARRRIRWDSQLRMRIFWLALFFVWLGFIWGWRFQQYSRGVKRDLFGPTLPFAKAAGNAMKIVIWPILILPLSYVFTTSLRSTWIDRIIPFDDAIYFHMMVGMIGGSMVIMHTICHIVDYSHAPHQSREKWAAAFPNDPEPKTFGDLMNQESTYLGFAMVTTLTVMFAFALPYPRKARWLRNTAIGRVLNNYNWFWATHKLGGGIFYTLLVLHPLPGRANTVEDPFALNAAPSEWGVSDTWVWVTLPIAIRLVDRTIRWWRRNEASSKITGAEFMTDGIVALEISRPPNFHFRPGSYVYLRVPEVARAEWHPFSLAGAPNAASLSVLLRDSGDWAKGLQALLKERLRDTSPTATGALRAAYQSVEDRPDELLLQKRALASLQLRVDGPFGAPAVAYRRYPVVLLVGAGIGVTPFLSMLADAVEQHAQRAAESRARQGCVQRHADVIQKVHFYWLVRDPSAPRWLRRTLETAAAADVSGLLDVNIHMTRATSRNQSYVSLKEALGSSELKMDADAAELGECATDTQCSTVKAWHGRPNFEEVFERLERDHAGSKVGVFYCGPPTLGGALAALSLRHSARGRATFHFRREHF